MYVLFLFPTEKKKKKDIIATLKAKGYDSDPVKTWKKSLESAESVAAPAEEGEEEEEEEEGESDYNYLLSMSLWSLSLEKVEELLKKKKEKVRCRGDQIAFCCHGDSLSVHF